MSIHDEHGERKTISTTVKHALTGRGYMILLVLGTGIASFFLGHLSAREHNARVVLSAPSFLEGIATSSGNSEYVANVYTASAVVENQSVVASKKGTMYYLPWCSQVSRIKPENRVTFISEAAAQSAGYVRSAACFGSLQ